MESAHVDQALKELTKQARNRDVLTFARNLIAIPTHKWLVRNLWIRQDKQEEVGGFYTGLMH